ncbi:MAG: amidohydrolase family protein [Spirochaetia bacterium]
MNLFIPYTDGPIFDCHAHPRGLSGKGPLDTEALDRLVSHAREFGVTGMASLGEVLFKVERYTAEEIRMINHRNNELASRHPGFFLPFCFLDPMLGEEFIRNEIDRCRREYGFRHIKLEMACNASHPAVDPVFRTAGELGFPVLVHAASNWTTGKTRNQTDSMDVRKQALKFPDTVFIAAHLTALGVRGVRALEDCANTAVDTSGMQPDAGIVEYAVKHLGEHRVLFGSDVAGRDLSVQIAQVAGADIAADVKRRIFWDNSREWFKL